MSTKEKVVIGLLEATTVIVTIGTAIIWKKLFDIEKR